ncbi:hypothetical protein J4Q44_G00241700 [Coregonus suidteri]|uniref:Uncharacterized protein n=1 Tax=Coregonus suidteri TaxID=861788 RepID=A0AAN8QIP4_9TELE
MDETIDAIASAGPPAGTTPDSCITTASASQCATPVGAARVPSCRRRPHAYSPGHTIVGPSTPPLQTPAPPSHRRRFCPPPPQCTPPPMSVTTNTASSGPTSSSVSPGHTTIAASSGVPAPCNLNTTTSTVNSTSPQVISASSKTSAASSRAQKRKRKATPVTSVTPPMAPLSEDTTCCARCGERDPPASSPQECRSEELEECFLKDVKDGKHLRDNMPTHMSRKAQPAVYGSGPVSQSGPVDVQPAQQEHPRKTSKNQIREMEFITCPEFKTIPQ